MNMFQQWISHAIALIQKLQIFNSNRHNTTILDDNVRAAKADNHNEEIKCIICEKKFKSVSNLDKHDRKFHMTKEPVPRYRCFHCTKISQNKKNLCDHMTTEHKICLICEKVFLSEVTLDNHKKVNHRTNFYKHSLERDPSMKNHKIKKFK